MLSILSGILGFATSGLPSVLKFFEQKGDQNHEREMAKIEMQRSLAMAEKGFASQEKIEELKSKARKVNDKPSKSFSWWKFDNEYITGSQYFGRSMIGFFLSINIVGFYLQAVTAYKRSKSLGNTKSTYTFFGIWGALSPIIGFSPAAPLNIIPHWYLWFSNGRNPNRRNLPQEY